MNTLDWRGREDPVEYLCRYRDLLQWGREFNILSAAHAKHLERRADSPAAKAALERALQFREAAYRVLLAIVRRRAFSHADLELVNRVILQARAHSELQFDRGTFGWTFNRDDDLNLPVWGVAHSLSGLLTSDDLSAVRECPGAKCEALFLDTTKNRRRRWCSMRGCGNRAKAKRHYAHAR